MPSLALITVFGLGHMRPASGTWGSLPTVVIAGGLWALGQSPGAGVESSGNAVYHGVLAMILVTFSAACVRFGDAAEAKWGHDPAEVVADETAGQCVPLLLLPASAFADGTRALATLAGAFVLFRIFDILKPWPAGRLQRVAGGWGIVLDDLMAGVYAAVVLQGVLRVV
jgi:phosphatidylglycerophosphatase A